MIFNPRYNKKLDNIQQEVLVPVGTSLCLFQHPRYTCCRVSSRVLYVACLVTVSLSVSLQGDRPKMVGSDWTVETGGDQWDAGIVDVLDEEFQKANGGLSLKGDAMALTR